MNYWKISIPELEFWLAKIFFKCLVLLIERFDNFSARDSFRVFESQVPLIIIVNQDTVKNLTEGFSHNNYTFSHSHTHTHTESLFNEFESRGGHLLIKMLKTQAKGRALLLFNHKLNNSSIASNKQ